MVLTLKTQMREFTIEALASFLNWNYHELAQITQFPHE